MLDAYATDYYAATLFLFIVLAIFCRRRLFDDCRRLLRHAARVETSLATRAVRCVREEVACVSAC